MVGAADPYLAELNPKGGTGWAHAPRQADFRNQSHSLALSKDGQAVDFGYKPPGEAQARFNLSARILRHGLPADGKTALTEIEGLPIEHWDASEHPMLGGAPLALERYETSLSLALDPKGARFVLGTTWWLRAYDAQGQPLWQQAAPGTAWAINISGDGRLVVAAYGDGTIRWHRMDDGQEFLAFFPLADRTNWVAWTPDGFYAATPGAHGVLRWLIKHGWHAPGEAIPVSDIAELRRPEVLSLVLQEMDIVEALGIAKLNAARLATQRRLNSAIKPGTRCNRGRHPRGDSSSGCTASTAPNWTRRSDGAAST